MGTKKKNQKDLTEYRLDHYLESFHSQANPGMLIVREPETTESIGLLLLERGFTLVTSATEAVQALSRDLSVAMVMHRRLCGDISDLFSELPAQGAGVKQAGKSVILPFRKHRAKKVKPRLLFLTKDSEQAQVEERFALTPHLGFIEKI